jgi:ABC-type nitrate/sulfonate/bicarbonate transport system permease component
MSTVVEETPVAVRRRRLPTVTPGKPGWIRRYVVPAAVVVVLVLIWQWRTTAVRSPFWPAPFDIADEARSMFLGGPAKHLWLSDLMVREGLPTVRRMLAGFILGSAAGLLIGVFVGLFRTFRETVSPAVEFLRSVPASATLPLFIILLGGEDKMRIAFIAFGVSWFVLINTARGVESIHPTQLMMGQSFRVSRVRRMFRIIIPAAMPEIFAGLRIALTSALIFAIVSEFMVASNGIGYELTISQARFQFLSMWAWMLLLAILGLLFNVILEAIESRVLRWHRHYRNQGS